MALVIVTMPGNWVSEQTLAHNIRQRILKENGSLQGFTLTDLQKEINTYEKRIIKDCGHMIEHDCGCCAFGLSSPHLPYHSIETKYQYWLPDTIISNPWFGK
jgi:hypothetical protein